MQLSLRRTLALLNIIEQTMGSEKYEVTNRVFALHQRSPAA